MHYIRRSAVLALCMVSAMSFAACGPSAPEVMPSPRPSRVVILPQGARIRAEMPDRSKHIGRVLVATDTTSRTVIIAPEGDATAPPDTLAFDAMRSLDVRGKSGGRWGLFGFYLGGFTGAVIRSPDRVEDGGPMAVGMLGGALVGALIGSRVESWLPVFPCVHGCASGPQM